MGAEGDTKSILSGHADDGMVCEVEAKCVSGPRGKASTFITLKCRGSLHIFPIKKIVAKDGELSGSCGHASFFARHLGQTIKATR